MTNGGPFTNRLLVNLEGRDVPSEVTVDQRDVAAWEGSEHYSEHTHTVRLRFLAWNAMKRAGATSATWKVFNTSDCVSVWPAEVPAGADEEQEGEQEPNPGQ